MRLAVRTRRRPRAARRGGRTPPSSRRGGAAAARSCHIPPRPRRGRASAAAWEYTGQAKIAVKCPTESELQALKSDATARGLCSYLVHDAGRTQIAPNSKTVLALGPAPVAVFDDFTAHLKLY